MGKEIVNCICWNCGSTVEQWKEHKNTVSPLKDGYKLLKGSEYDNQGHCPECGKPFKVSSK